MEKKLSKAGPKVYHDNVKGAMPTLRMRDAEGKVVEEVNVAEWKADDILAFLKDKLDDEPLVKVSRADAPKDAKRGAKGTKDSKGGKVKVSRGKPYDPDNKDVPPGYHRDWGVKYDRIGKSADSLAAFARAVKWASASQKARAHLNLGVAQMRASKFKEARASMSAALELDADFKDAQENIAVLDSLQAEDEEEA